MQADSGKARGSLVSVARQASDLPADPVIVVTNPDDDCSSEACRVLIDKLLAGPEPDSRPSTRPRRYVRHALAADRVGRCQGSECGRRQCSMRAGRTAMSGDHPLRVEATAPCPDHWVKVNGRSYGLRRSSARK
ncbi:MAG: hypothetical protein NVS3B21_31150 [Acidimicrobiales bacterium]